MPQAFWQHFGSEIKNWRRSVNTKTEQTDLGFSALTPCSELNFKRSVCL